MHDGPENRIDARLHAIADPHDARIRAERERDRMRASLLLIEASALAAAEGRGGVPLPDWTTIILSLARLGLQDSPARPGSAGR